MRHHPYRVSIQLTPPYIASHADWETQVCPSPGAIAPERGRCKEKTMDQCAGRKSTTRRSFRHLFREGRGIIPGRAI